ncbi:hypothetical protein M0805_005103 [Coniferiporia weirii]|nr:hypothetical protein M0805_005103 [Coniferiporia weirii]
MLSFIPSSSIRLLRTPCLRLAHHRYVSPLGSVRFLPRTARTDAHDPDSHKSGISSFREELSKESPAPFTHNASNTSPGAGLESVTRQSSFRTEMLKEDPTFEQTKFGDEIGRPGIWKQVAFAAGFTLLFFLHSAELTGINTKELSAAFPAPLMITSEHLRRVRVTMVSEKLKATLQKLKDALVSAPSSLSYPFLWAYVQVANGYINASEGKRVGYQICAVNGLVWLMWQIKSLQPFMRANFTHHPLSGKYFTLLTSIFSHQSFIHLLANSFALVSFGSAATTYLSKKQAENREGLLESTPKYHFLAVFVGAGLFSALTSHVVAARITYPRLLSQFRASKAATAAISESATAFRRAGQAIKEKAAAAVPRDILPSLGASGAIYATVTITALAYPDAQVFLLFPPIPLPITWGVGGMVAMDMIGIIRGWRFFDHWAHLSGAAFGVLYYKYGPDYWNYIRALNAERDLEKR